MASETDDAPRDVSRRDLFKTVGAGAAAAVAGAPLAPSPTRRTDRSSKRSKP